MPFVLTSGSRICDVLRDFALGFAVSSSSVDRTSDCASNLQFGPLVGASLPSGLMHISKQIRDICDMSFVRVAWSHVATFAPLLLLGFCSYWRI